MLRYILVALCCFHSLSALAVDASSGCGPGWYILKNNSLVSSYLRTITHAFLAPTVTFGMTTGTSNCTKHSIVEESKQSEALLTVTFDKLRQDVAQGQGVFLNAYADTFKCASDDKALFGKTVQANYSKIFVKDHSPENIVENTKQVLAKEPKLATSCKAV